MQSYLQVGCQKPTFLVYAYDNELWENQNFSQFV